MSALETLHDGRLLRFIQQWFYGYSAVSIAAVLLLLVALPTHRRSGRALIVVTGLWCLLCLTVYGALREAPILGGVMVVCLAYAALRAVAWSARIPHERADDRNGGALGRLPAAWAQWIIRDYFRADPRGVWWLDLAAAVRGRTPARTLAERRLAADGSFELPAWRRWIWQRLIFPPFEWRIRLAPHLPRYWSRPHVGLRLDDEHIAAVLRDEIRDAVRHMHAHEAGESFAEYMQRAVEPERLAEHQRRAGAFGRKCCLLREAMAECMSFGTARTKRDAGLEQAAVWCYETWQFRRQYDRLWMDETSSRSATDVTDPGQTTAAPQGNGDAPSEGTGSGRRGERAAAPDGIEWSTPEEPDLTGELDLDPSDSPALGFEEATAVATEEALQFEGEAAEAPTATAVLEDLEAFASLEPDDQPAARSAVAVASLSREEQERHRDLIQACALLEAYLDLSPGDDPPQRIRAAERLLDREPLMCAAVRLLMLYALRSDLQGHRIEPLKVELVTQLRKRFREVPRDNATAVRARRIFNEMYIDLLFSRSAYGSLRELFSHREPGNEYQWRLLGLADASLASQIRDRPHLRDTLIQEAAAAFFRARVPGFWTQSYLGLLLATPTARDTVRLLQAHPVEFGRPTIPRVSGRLPRPADSAPVAAPAAEPQLRLRMVPHKPGDKDYLVAQFPYMLKKDVLRVVLLRGRPALEDLTHGRSVRLNGQPLDGPALLSAGDKIQCGKSVLEVRSV